MSASGDSGSLSARRRQEALDTENPKVMDVLADFVSAASFQPVAKITPSAWTEHAPFAFWLIDALRPQGIVELGVFHGFSYLVMCQAASGLSLRPHCHGVDNWSGDEHVGTYGEEVFETLKNYHDPLYSDFSLLMRSSFDEAAPQFADGSVDLLHIDGRHSYEAVRHDFETWRPKLSDQAVILFHDTNVREAGFGVWKLWEQLSQRYPSFEFLHGHGLGVLGYGRRLPAPLERLFSVAKDDETAEAIRGVYRRLGAPYAEMERLQEVSAKIKLNPMMVNVLDLLLAQGQSEKTQNEKLAVSFLPVSHSEFGSHPEYDEVFRLYTQDDRNRGMDVARLLAFGLNVKHVLQRCPGSLAEVGVYQGQSAAVLSYYARQFSRNMYIADTFSGFAEAQYESNMSEGKISAFKDVNLDRVRSLIGNYDGNRWIVGTFPDSVTAEMKSDDFAFVSIDCNLYAPVLACLNFFWPRMNPGGQILVHDYSSGHWPGATQAVNEFCDAHNAAGMLLPDYTGTYVITKQLSRDFSQYGEQQIILDFFSRTKRPYSRYCVDAGAHDGAVGSNSRALFMSGWAGLAIEPNPRSFARLNSLYESRPDIKCLRLALSNKKRSNVPMKFSIGPAGVAKEHQWMYGQVSTLDSKFARSYEVEHAYRYVTERVDIDTLTNIMRSNGVPKDFGFLSIDCEGQDLKILKEINFDVYRPLLICVECNDRSRPEFADVLAPFGYKFIAQTRSNAFFERLSSHAQAFIGNPTAKLRKSSTASGGGSKPLLGGRPRASRA